MVRDCPGYSREFDPTRMMSKILVPIDFTPESRCALITACEMRLHFGSEIHLFVETGSGQPSGLRGLGVVWGPGDIAKDARQMLSSFADSICKGGACVASHATFGEDIVKGIADAAEECGATIVIMGIHNKNSLLRTRAEKIMKNLSIPVMVLQHVVHLRSEPTQAGKEHAGT